MPTSRFFPLALLFASTSLSLPAAVAFVNGDFEANADQYLVWPGYSGTAGLNGLATNPDAPTGWVISGFNVGLNNEATVFTDEWVPISSGDPVSPFANNGAATGSVVFLQQEAWIEQTVNGFTPGVEYVLSFDANARASGNIISYPPRAPPHRRN